MSGGYSPFHGPGPMWSPEYSGPGDFYNSPTTTPSPSHHVDGYPPPPHPMYSYDGYVRPATRAAHTRSNTMHFDPTFRAPSASPRYRSTGEYATRDEGFVLPDTGSFAKAAFYADVPSASRRPSNHPPPANAAKHPSSRRPSMSTPSRKASMSVPPQQQQQSHRDSRSHREPREFREPPREHREHRTHHREPSTPGPQPRRSSSARPERQHKREGSTHHGSATPAPSTPKTKGRKPGEEDRKKWKIPKGYNMKNWDPNDAPILLLGSVFDSNSVGKWIYDWTTTVHGANSPFADMAGELWLLLIQLYGTVARMEKVVNRVRSEENRETIKDFLKAGDRLTTRFQALIKDCSAPMVQNGSSLVANAGQSFVEVMFGRSEKLPELEKYLQHVRTYNHRFEANCEKIVTNPTR